MTGRPFVFVLAVLALSGARAWAQDPAPRIVISEVPSDTLPAESTSAEALPAEDHAVILEDTPTITEQFAEGAQDDSSCYVVDFTFDFPNWYFRGDALWFARTGDGELTTATLRDNAGSLGNYRIGSMAFDTEPGFRVHIGKNVWDNQTYVDLVYFGLHHWNTADTLEAVVVNNVTFGLVDTNLDLGLGDGNLDGSFARNPTSQIVDYSSNLHNAEVNARSFFSPAFAFVGGMRYMNLSETLVITERGTVPFQVGVQPFNIPYLASRNTAVGNSLLGFQIGGDHFCRITDDIRWNTMGRLGLMANFSESTVRQSAQRFFPAGIAGTSRVQVDKETVFTGLVEFGMGLDIQLTRNLSFHGGYQLLWVHGVAQAPEQRANDINDANGIQSQIENGSDALFYGPYIGLELGWGQPDE